MSNINNQFSPIFTTEIFNNRGDSMGYVGFLYKAETTKLGKEPGYKMLNLVKLSKTSTIHSSRAKARSSLRG